MTERSKFLDTCELSSAFVSRSYSAGQERSSGNGRPLHTSPAFKAEDSGQEQSVRLLMAGGMAGVVSKTLTAPLGRLTILYQTQGFASLGYTPRLDAAFSHVVQTEGIRALWKGNMATILHRLPYSSASFLVYEESLKGLQTILPKEENAISGKTDIVRRLLAGALAGSISTAFAYPIDLARTRLAAQTSHQYKGIWDVLKRTYVEEQLLGLYKGLGGSLLQVVPNLAVNLCAYETLRSYWIQQNWTNDVTDTAASYPGVLGSIICGGTSGIISSTVTYPIDLIRRRMQLQGQHGAARTYHSYADAFHKTWGSGGARAFFVGIVAEYTKVVPGVAIIYAVYETMKRSLRIETFNKGGR